MAKMISHVLTIINKRSKISKWPSSFALTAKELAEIAKKIFVINFTYLLSQVAELGKAYFHKQTNKGYRVLNISLTICKDEYRLRES